LPTNELPISSLRFQQNVRNLSGKQLVSNGREFSASLTGPTTRCETLVSAGQSAALECHSSGKSAKLDKLEY